MARQIGRRALLERTVFLPVLAAGAGLALTACGEDEELTCTDTSGLSEAELAMRQQQEYTDSTPYPEKTCDNCQLFQAPSREGTCGGCQVIKGPIHPKGYCKLWVAKTT